MTPPQGGDGRMGVIADAKHDSGTLGLKFRTAADADDYGLWGLTLYPSPLSTELVEELLDRWGGFDG